MIERLSIVMTGHGRVELLERSLFATCRWQNFEKKQAELVYVDDVTPDKEALRTVLKRYAKYFYKTTLVHMDKTKSKIPIRFNDVSQYCSPSLGMNIAVKQAENEIILKTDPECLPLTDTVKVALDRYSCTSLLFFKVRHLVEKENSNFTVAKQSTTHPRHLFESLFQGEDLWHISERKRLPYWFGCVFSRTEFMDAGGMDEEFLRGFAGEDDEWAERMVRRGSKWRWSDDLVILHQFHGHQNQSLIHTPAHVANIERLAESRARATMVANKDHEWGSDSVVVGREELE